MSSWITKIKNKIETLERISKQKRINFYTIHKNHLKLYLDENNRFHLYCKDNEFAKGNGLDVNILSEGNWHSSIDSTVNNIEKPSSEEIILYFNHNQLPLVQIWHLKFNSEGMISWEINMHIKESMRIDCSNARLFLSKSYNRWIVSPEEGSFPSSFGTEWQRMNSCENNAEFIGLSSLSEGFPDIVCKTSENQNSLLVIQNTGFNLSSRVLEIQRKDNQEFYQPGTYPYLKATIQFYPDKSVLENMLKEIQEQERKRQKEERRIQEQERKRLQEEEQKRLEELERLRQEEEQKIKEQERKKQEEERRKQEQERKRLQEEEQKRLEELERLRQEEEQKIKEQERKKQEEERRKQEQERKRLEEKERIKQEQERKRQKKDQKMRTLKSGSFTLCLDIYSRFHIYYKDNEITKAIGLNAGIFSEGNWYGSSDSQVKIERPSSDEMVVYFTHNKIPVVQIWNLRFAPEDIMEWEVKMHIKEPLRIDMKNASLFLSKAYEGWIASPEEGKFPSSFSPEWQMMNTSSVNRSDFIGLYSSLADLPDITFKNSKDSKGSFLIQNTDIEHSSRVLEIQFEEKKELYQSGIYPYLKASFQLYPDKSVLENMLKEIKEQERKRQEEEQKRLQELERLRQEQERRKQEQEWKKHEERLRRIQEKIKKVYVKTGETAELVTLKEGYIKKDDSIYIYGDNEDLHDRVSFRQGDFKKSISKIKTAINKNKNIKIGISKFNFFKLNEIAQFCSSLMNRRLDLRSVVLNPLPLKKLYLNFFDYIRELNARIGSDQIEFFLKDEKLLNLLYSVSSQANQYNERELLRLLGVISEHPFIGPQTIVLDTYHRCNTNCIHCWIHTPKRILSPELVNLKMDFSLYKNIVNDAVDLLCDEIIIQGDGEPLLDNRFLEMVQYARNKGLKVIFFTNAILLDEKKAKRVIELEIDEIYCSLPAGTDKTYAVINSKQSKETFHKIAHNLKNFILLRNKLKRNKPSLQMTHVIHDLNHHELEEMARLDAHIGADRARFYLARLDENIKSLKVKPDHIEIMKKSLKKVAPYLKKEHIELQDNIWFQLKNYNSKTGRWSGDKFLKSGCPVGWFFCLILAKGELSMCCHLRVVDYLGGKSFKEAWNSESYNKFRSQAKYIMKNKDITFRNGVKLYDEYCNNCDTHQVILRINELLKKYNLEQFYKGSVI